MDYFYNVFIKVEWAFTWEAEISFLSSKKYLHYCLEDEKVFKDERTTLFGVYYHFWVNYAQIWKNHLSKNENICKWWQNSEEIKEIDEKMNGAKQSKERKAEACNNEQCQRAPHMLDASNEV